jgi:excisionase family DNA binding protein
MHAEIRLLRTHEAAALARNSARTIRRWKDAGRLKAYRSHPGRGGHLLFRREDVLACLGITESADLESPKNCGAGTSGEQAPVL